MNKAFTLAELMGVIVILGIIATVVTFTVDRNIKKGRIVTCQAQEKTIIEAAKTWAIDNSNELPKTSSSTKRLDIETDLQDNGYLDAELINPMTGEKYTEAYVDISITDGNADYTYAIGFTNPNSKEKCS